MSITVLELREELETLLADHLGQYTLANGFTTPAITVRAVGEPMPAGTSVEGMELVIVRDPDLDPLRQYRAPKAFRRWQLYLVGWSVDADIETAASLILAAYPSATMATLKVPESVGPEHQIRIELTTAPPET